MKLLSNHDIFININKFKDIYKEHYFYIFYYYSINKLMLNEKKILFYNMKFRKYKNNNILLESILELINSCLLSNFFYSKEFFFYFLFICFNYLKFSKNIEIFYTTKILSFFIKCKFSQTLEYKLISLFNVSTEIEKKLRRKISSLIIRILEVDRIFNINIKQLIHSHNISYKKSLSFLTPIASIDSLNISLFSLFRFLSSFYDDFEKNVQIQDYFKLRIQSFRYVISFCNIIEMITHIAVFNINNFSLFLISLIRKFSLILQYNTKLQEIKTRFFKSCLSTNQYLLYYKIRNFDIFLIDHDIYTKRSSMKTFIDKTKNRKENIKLILKFSKQSKLNYIKNVITKLSLNNVCNIKII